MTTSTLSNDGDPPPVVVAGGGPTGLTAANLLGSYGVPVVVVERNESTSDEAKAISLDDESLRTMQCADVDAEVMRIVVPGTGTRYYGPSGRLLFHARGGGGNPFDHPFKNAFAQPELERVLHAGLARFPHIQVRFGTELTGLDTRPDGATVTLRTVAAGVEEQLAALAVLACDGGRSTVRELLGIQMNGTSSGQLWLVLDAVNDDHDQRFSMHHGDPRRPHVIVPGRDGRCRYEFRLYPGEGRAGQPPDFELARRLVSGYRDLRPEDIERSVVYGFHSLVAGRLREQRTFLLGDAAHMMPPFAGQGLNSGIRDAANLAFKIALLHQGTALDPLLDSYQAERKPHAQAMVDFSSRLGDVVMTTSRHTALFRDTAVRLALLTRHGRRYLKQMRFRPPNRIADGLTLPSGDRGRDGLIGTLLPQPRVLTGPAHNLVRLDDMLGAGFALVGADVRESDWAAARSAGLPLPGLAHVEVRLDDRTSRGLAGRASIADYDGTLESYFARLRGCFVLVRPDRMVAAIVTPAELPRLRAFLDRFLQVPAPHRIGELLNVCVDEPRT